ncbi:MAG TPA: DUF2892 domain-containing protein [Bacillota bacterium]|nr:DUF2892 domain-containing protein [Bacillota bacterium]HOL09596.1 DUF2892 domain-containing protein [Bacillota bacterium]HPO97243.1 DUF2892 domain-containing protein [Bacillota bacterium]
MKNNVGLVDRITRIIIGCAMLAVVFLIPGNERWWGLLGIIPVLTGILGICPIYSFLGIRTCPWSE